jgi:hypothetical protein
LAAIHIDGIESGESSNPSNAGLHEGPVAIRFETGPLNWIYGELRQKSITGAG